MEDCLGVPLGALSEVAAVAIAENTLFFAVATKQADRSNGGLRGLRAIAEAILELRICELTLGLVREHRQRHSGYGIQLRPENGLGQEATKGLEELFKTLHIAKAGDKPLEFPTALPCPQTQNAGVVLRPIETTLLKIASTAATVSCYCKTATLELQILLKVPSRTIFSSGKVTLNQLGLEKSFEAGLLVVKLLGPSAGIFQTRIFRGGGGRHQPPRPGTDVKGGGSG
jgi:hypothetical protein